MEPIVLKRGNFLPVIIVSFLLLLTTFVISSHVVNTSSGGSSFSVDEDVVSVFNFSINHTGLGNLTHVNITIPSSFSFGDGTNGSSISLVSSFSNTTVLLSWVNDTIGLALNYSEDFFWFNATPSTPGDYNITVLTYNGTDSDETNITVTVNDTTVPYIEYNTTQTPSNNSNLSLTYIIVNVSASDIVGVDNITVYLYNSSYDLVDSNSSVGPSVYSNFSSLSEGVYYINATANDSASNENSTETITVTLDTTDPVILLLSPLNATSSTTASYNFTFNATDNYGFSNCSVVMDGSVVASSTGIANGTNGIVYSSIAAGTHNWTVNCTDSAGNVATNSSVRSLTVTSSGGSSGSSSSGLGAYYLTEEFFVKGYDKVLYRNWIVRFKLGDVYHTVRLDSINDDSVDLVISSDPIEVSMRNGEEKKFDLDGDSYYDLYVRVNSIGEYKANVTFRKLNESIQLVNDLPSDSEGGEISDPDNAPEENSEVQGESSNEGSGGFSWVILVVILIVIIALVAYFWVRSGKGVNKFVSKKTSKK